MRYRTCQILIAAFLLPLCQLGAFELIHTNDFALTEQEVILPETIVISQNARIDGVAEDDFYALSLSNIVSGTFRSDTWLGAVSLEAGGWYEDDLRLIGQQILTRAKVKDDLSAIGQVVQAGKETVVGDRLLAIGSEVVINATVSGRTRVIAEKATLGGTFSNDVHVLASDVVLMRGVHIDGNLYYSSDQELFVDDQMFIGGEIIREDRKAVLIPSLPMEQALYLQFAFFLAAVLCGMPFVGLFPRYSGSCVHLVRTQSWRCMLVGLIMLLLIPLASFLVLGTIIGIPLGLIMVVLLAIGVYLSKIVMALVIGSFVLRRRGYQSFLSVMLVLWGGLLFLYIADLVPILGDVVWVASTLLGLGSMTIALFAGNVVRLTPQSSTNTNTNG